MGVFFHIYCMWRSFPVYSSGNAYANWKFVVSLLKMKTFVTSLMSWIIKKRNFWKIITQTIWYGLWFPSISNFFLASFLLYFSFVLLHLHVPTFFRFLFLSSFTTALWYNFGNLKLYQDLYIMQTSQVTWKFAYYVIEVLPRQVGL